LYVGECFKKCSLLTSGEFTHRTAAATCCSTTGLGCWNLANDKTSEAFNVGGGAGDHDASTPSEVHFPLKSLTEEMPSPSPSAYSAAITAAAAKGDLTPAENMTDGNVCSDNEEMHDGLCYGTCSALTNGEAPIRTSPWTCCESHPCSIRNQRGQLGTSLLCKGFDVSGDGSCPHNPGACLVDEEMFLGVCYKKCSLLTSGEHPYRIAPATCSKFSSGWDSLNPFNGKTSKSFDVGGGAGDSEDAEAHMPEQRLTESGGIAVIASAPAVAVLALATRQGDKDPAPRWSFRAATAALKKTVQEEEEKLKTVMKKRRLRTMQ